MNTNPEQTNKYELQELLGRVGMVEVWKAFDTGARRYVAIKFLHINAPTDLNFVTRFQHETLAIAALYHPNIVQYYDFSILQSPAAEQTTVSMVMNYVDGGTLADYIQNTSRKGKFLSTTDTVRLFTAIATAIGYAHEHGIIHGQLKPTNILLDKRDTSYNIMGMPVVTDFGINKLLGIAAGATGNTGSWQGGVPIYMSPEQITGASGDARSDIYSLGIMLYEMCAGTPPFQGNNAATVMMQHINTAPTSPALINPGIPAALTAIIMRCIAKEPWARFPSMSALLEALAQVDGNETIEASATQSLAVSASQPDYSVKSMDLPTILTRSPLPPGMYTPSSPGISGISFSPLPPGMSSPGFAGQGNQAATPYYYTTPTSQVGSSQPYPTAQPIGQLTPMPPTAYVGPLTPMPATAIAEQPAQSLPAAPSIQPPVPAPARKRGGPALRVALIALVILVVLGSGLGAYLAFFSKGPSTTKTPPANTLSSSTVGHAYFVSSGLLIPTSTKGITDQLQINLQNVPAPPAGKAYYAWLLNDTALQWNPLYLGRLNVKSGGTIDFAFQGNTTDLLATNSRFLITEDDAASAPVSPDSGTYSYYAAFPEIKHQSGSRQFSLYDHLRHLLALDPTVAQDGLVGGLDTWLYRNSLKILEWTGSARDATFAGSGPFIKNQLTRIMCYLDGASFIQQDIPGATCSDQTVALGAKIGLLSIKKGSFGYLQHISSHLHELSTLPEATTEQRTLAFQIFQAMDTVNLRYTYLYNDVVQLLHMTFAQWSQPAGVSLLDSITTLANDAFVGQVDPQGHITDGVAQINYDIQRLATFNVRACTTSNPCSIQ